MANERTALKTEVASLLGKDKNKYIDVTLHDPTPTDSVERKMYVSKVAGFHKDIFEKKIQYMISVAHTLSESIDNERDFDLVMKGVVYAFREFLKWGDSMVNEQIANQIENKDVDEDRKVLQEALNKN